MQPPNRVEPATAACEGKPEKYALESAMRVRGPHFRNLGSSGF
jgi:hypothetical protein